MRHPGFAPLRLVSTLVLALLALMLPGAQSTAQVASPITAGIALLSSFSGIAPSTSQPLDPTIAAGPDRLVVASNDVVVIRDKAGALIASKDLRVFLAAVRAAGEDRVFSPRVVFDPDSERFFLVAAAHNRPTCMPTCVSHYLLAVSKSATPATLDAADWHFDTLDARMDTVFGAAPTFTNNFADLPDIGVDEHVLVITSVQRDADTGAFVTAKVRRMLKVFAVDGIGYTPSDWIDFVDINVPGTATRVRAVHPADMSGAGLTRFFLTSRMPGPATNDCGMIVWSLDNLLALTTLTGKVVAKTGGCAPSPAAHQQGSATTLQTSQAASGHTARPVYRNGSLWDVESVQRTVSGQAVSAVRWMQLNVAAWPAPPTFVQDQFISTAGTDHFYPAIMADASNNAFLVYGRSSAGGEFASAYVTGRAATDAVNTLSTPALLQAGTAALGGTSPAPFGQYFSAALDPDDGGVWVVGQYAASATTVGAWVGNLSGPQKLTVIKQGNGTGTVSSVPAGIACPTDCTEFYDAGVGVTLTATPTAGSYFTGWGGACGGLGATCDVVMDRSRSVNAGFALQSVIKFSAASYSTTEPASVTTNASITVTRTGGLHAGVTVQFATVAEVGPGKATAGVDYEPRLQTLTFPAGLATVTATVPIIPDTLAEGPETVKLLLSNPAGGAVLGSPVEATLTIQDNDTAGVIQFVLSTFEVTEPVASPTTTRITVTRASGSASGVTVNFRTSDGTATTGLDYEAVNTTLTFAAGELTKFVDITILPDALVEGDETVLLTLSAPGAPATLGTQKTAVLTIRDAQTGLQFTAPTYTVIEGTASATITVVRTGPLGAPATVSYSSSDGTATGGADYTPVSGTLSFKAGDSVKTFTVPILNDTGVEGPETVLLLLSNFNGAAPGPLSSAILTITDNDVAGTVKLSAATFSASEALGVATITVSRSGGTAGGLTADYATADQPCVTPPCPGLAQAGIDYEAALGTLTFGSGETTKTVLIPIFNDTLVEGTETFLFNLSNPAGGATLGSPTQAVVSILDNDQGGAIQFGAATYTGTEALGVSSTASITITRTGTSLASGASVQFATSNGTATAGVNYTATVTTLVFAAGETTKTVPIPILSGGASGDLTVNLTLANPAGGATLGTRTSAVLTIVDATKVVQFSATAYTVTEGTAATITVLRGGSTTGAVSVPYTTADGSGTAPTHYATKTGTLVFPAGSKSQIFTVTTVNTSIVDGDRTVNLSLGAPTGGAVLGPNAAATLTIKDNDAPGAFQFGSAAYSVVEGGASPVIVTRIGGSGGTVVLTWAATGGSAAGGPLPTSPGADYAPMSGSLTFGPGITSRPLPLTIVNDTIAEAAETVVLELTGIVSSSAGAASIGGPASTTLTILDNDVGGTIEFMTTAVSVAENVAGGKATLTVKRSITGTTPLGSGVLVDYAVTPAGTTAVLSNDYTLPGTTLTFAAGQTSVPLQITIVNDLITPIAETNKTIQITLSNPRSIGPATGGNKPVLGAATSATVTIVDEEPRLAFGAAAFSVNEGASILVPVIRTGPTTGTITVDVTGVSGTATVNTDFAIAPGTLTFGPGVTKLNVIVGAPDDAVAEGAEQATLQLANPVGASLGTPSSATLTIQDNEAAGTIQFAAASLSAVEGRTARVTVTRTGSNLVGGVTVGWSVTSGTATAVDDFSPSSGTLTFDAGVTSRSFDVVTVDDSDAEGTETVVISLAPPSAGATLGTPSALTLFIVDTEQSVAFGRTTYSVGETVPQAVISVVRLGVPEGTVTVTAATVTASAIPLAVPGLDYTSVPPTVLTFGPGEILKTFSVPILTANALTRSGNRLVGLELSSPTGAVLGAASAATLTILDFRPDLVIATVSTPAGTLNGKIVSAPTTVRNLGLVPSPAFRVGLFIASADPLPGAGSLLTQRDVASLAPGASTSLPTQLSIDDDLPPGDYFVSAIADFQSAVPEGDEGNNGLASAPSFIRVVRNLTKFQSASASLSQSSPSSLRFLRSPQDVTCDAQGAINLSGSFTVTSQQAQDATGVADLTGTLNNDAVRYVITFAGTADDNDHVVATLTSISATGAFIGTGSGTFDGTLDGRTLSGTVSGTINTSTGGVCAFTGSLTAVASTSSTLKLATRIQPGSFGFDVTPDNVLFPFSTDGYAPVFTVLFDENFPNPSDVRFTGPAGSGYANTPGDGELSGLSPDGANARYIGVPRHGVSVVPGGVWSVMYKGTSRSFVLPAADFDARLVVPYPTVTVDPAGNLSQVDWVYRDRLTGAQLTAPPSFIKNVQVVLQPNGDAFEIESPLFDRSVTSYVVTSRPSFSDIRELSMRYTDLGGNLYFVDYGKAFNIQVEARLENTYGPSTSPGGFQQRLLQVFVDVPADSVDITPCFVQQPPDFFVSVVNDGAAGPFPSATCIPQTGRTQFDDDPTLIDIFSLRQDLTGPTLTVGTPFRFSVTPLDPRFGTLSVVTTLKNPEANTANDYIFIPNASTPTLKPAGTDFQDARLGQNMTVSWSLPSFAIQDQFFSPIVNLATGEFCQGTQQNLTPGTVSTTFKFPTTCFGQTPVQAQFCIFFKGKNGESSTGCWFFGDPG